MSVAEPLPRLSAQALAAAPAAVGRPAYARERHGIGVVHLGLGAFHRAHQAVYFDDLLATAGGDWAISGVSLRAAAVSEQLAPQDGLYTLTVLDGEAVRDRVIGAVREALFLGAERKAIAARLADPATRLITLTVTEKAYCLASLDGGLDARHPGVLADLAAPDAPGTVVGLLTQALATRRAAGVAPPTVMSCDNLPRNGSRLRRAVLDFAALREPGLAAWIRGEVAFPNTMVDRIVPRTTPADIGALATRTGFTDPGMVKAEPFSQWVVEDRFCNTRPALESVGALVVPDVDAFELLKLRMVLGAHSTIAYLACLAGLEYVHQAMASPIGALVRELLEREVSPVTPVPAGFDLAAYRGGLYARFANPGLMHLARQIAMDGSQKVPIRLLGTLSTALGQGIACPRLALAVAAWIRYASALPMGGREWAVDDPMAARLGAIGRDAGADADRLLEGFLAVEAVFPAPLAALPAFREPVRNWLRRLLDDGPMACVAAALAG